MNPLVIFFILLLVFLLLREFWCVYWKINKIVSLLKSIDKRLALLTHDEESLDG